MSKCPNCGAGMSCGCQRRILADGKVGCSRCIATSGKTAEPAPTPVVNKAILKNKE